jgi:hypothetical protein
MHFANLFRMKGWLLQNCKKFGQSLLALIEMNRLVYKLIVRGRIAEGQTG